MTERAANTTESASSDVRLGPAASHLPVAGWVLCDLGAALRFGDTLRR